MVYRDELTIRSFDITVPIFFLSYVIKVLSFLPLGYVIMAIFLILL